MKWVNYSCQYCLTERQLNFDMLIACNEQFNLHNYYRRQFSFILSCMIIRATKICKSDCIAHLRADLLFIYLFIYLFVCLFVCLFVYLFIFILLGLWFIVNAKSSYHSGITISFVCKIFKQNSRNRKKILEFNPFHATDLFLHPSKTSKN